MISIPRDRKKVHRKEVTFLLEEWEVVEKNANDLSVTTSEYIRRMTVEGTIAAYDFSSLVPVLDRLNTITEKISQMHAIARKYKKINDESLTKIESDIDQMRHMLIVFISDLRKKEGKT